MLSSQDSIPMLLGISVFSLSGSRESAYLIEMAFLKANIPIFSNAKNYRRAAHIPLVVPIVNTSHIIPLLESQRRIYGLNKRGFMVTNANCSTTGLVVPLKALQDKFGPLEKVSAVTMQAISGAGRHLKNEV